MRIYVLNLRVSSAEQSKNGLGLEAHEAGCDKLLRH